MQSSSSSRPFKPALIGASPITDAICPRSSVRIERQRAKLEVAGAIPAVDANFPGLWCNSSTSAREADSPGANPGFLTTFDGSQDWVIIPHDEVAGSSPVSGSIRRGSSAVEHVNPSSPFIRRSFFDGPKLWIIACCWFESNLPHLVGQ